MIEVRDLTIQARDFRLGPIDLKIERGSYCILLGPSGSGKTSLLEWIAGFRRARTGRLLVHGNDVTLAHPGSRDIALVFQEAALFPHMSVAENIAFPLRVRREPASVRLSRAQELAELLQIQHRLSARPATLSGGEQRRVALARALAVPQALLLLDEPLSAVDPGLQRDLIGLLAEVHRRLDVTVIHVTHSLFEARNLATTVGVMMDGKLAQFAPAEDVFSRPASVGIARALGLSNFVEGALTDDGASFALMDSVVKLPVASISGSGKRARITGLSLAPRSTLEKGLSALVVCSEVSTYGAPNVRVRLEEGDLELTVPSEGPVLGHPGEPVTVCFQSAHYSLFQ